MSNPAKMKKKSSPPRGELPPGTPHPAARDAMAWLSKITSPELYAWQETFASCAIDGNHLAEVCSETLRRLLVLEPVGERYLLGLAWTMRERVIAPADIRSDPYLLSFTGQGKNILAPADMRSVITKARRDDLWCRPVSMRGCGSAYCVEGGKLKTVPTLRGATFAIMPDIDDLLGAWEVVSPETVNTEK